MIQLNLSHKVNSLLLTKAWASTCEDIWGVNDFRCAAAAYSGKDFSSPHRRLDCPKNNFECNRICFWELNPVCKVHSKSVSRDVLQFTYKDGGSNSPDTSTTSPGTISLARIFWTPDLSALITLPISGSYSFSASMADSAFRSYKFRMNSIIEPAFNGNLP